MNDYKMGPKGLALLKEFEGLELQAYRDSVGVLTIGYGHTSMAGKPVVKAGMKITKDQAEAILKRDLKKYEDAVRNALRVPVTQEMFDAMVSLCYNIGPAGFRKSSVLRYTNKRLFDQADDKFLLWNKAGGRVLRGLTRRRHAEAELYRKGTEAMSVHADATNVMPDAPRGKSPLESTTNLAAGASAIAGVTAAGRQIAEDTGSILSVAPWAVTLIVIVGATFWIWRERKKKSEEHGI